ncbi:MAG: HlyD family secretion protein [Verrucomicrobiota bacterium]
MANPKKRRKLLVFSVIGLVLVALTLAAIFRKKDAVVTVQTEKVTRRNITEIVVANGKIQPVTQVVISPEVAGEIVALPVKEGQQVKKGDLLVQIKPDNYNASRNSAEANYLSSIASKNLAQAQLDKAEAEFKRNSQLLKNHLVSESLFLEFKTAYEVAKLQYETGVHIEAQAKFGLDKAADDLSKTTILAPIDGTVSRLKSQLGERVLGTSFNMGTEIMTIADLNEMEARVDIGEMDVVIIAPGQSAKLEVDAFKDKKFTGTVTEIANSAKGLGQSSLAAASSSSTQEATKFEVHIRVKEKEIFRPGMSVTAEIETRSRTNVLGVPIASVTTRVLKPKQTDAKKLEVVSARTNSALPVTNMVATNPASIETNAAKDKKIKDMAKAVEVVFVVEGDHVKAVPVKIGISDENYYEITEGLQEGNELVSGSYRAIGHDLEDGKKITKGSAGSDSEKKEP